MAKSSKRRKQDQAKAAHKRAEQARRKVRGELTRQATLAVQRLLDPQTPPAEVAALVVQSMPDVVYLTARAAQRRVEAGAGPQEMAEAGRHLLAAYPQEPPVGALAFAVVAAHASGQEEEEHRLAAQLLDACRAVGEDAWLDVLDYVIAPWHPGETAELLEPYLIEHPEDPRAHWRKHRRGRPGSAACCQWTGSGARPAPACGSAPLRPTRSASMSMPRSRS